MDGDFIINIEGARDLFNSVLKMVYGVDDFNAENLYFYLEDLASVLGASQSFDEIVDVKNFKMAIRGK